jgi:hypothetical protein
MIRRLLRRLAEWVTNDRDDTVRVLLDRGSYEVSPEVEARYGREILDAMNRSSVPCDPNALYADGPWDSDDLPSTADPGIVTDPKED